MVCTHMVYPQLEKFINFHLYGCWEVLLVSCDWCLFTQDKRIQVINSVQIFLACSESALYKTPYGNTTIIYGILFQLRN